MAKNKTKRPNHQAGMAPSNGAGQDISPNGRQTRIDLLICAAATVALLLPFVSKAVHIDDTLFIYAAKQISSNPGDPFGFNINWYGVELPMSSVTQNGPLASYYMVLAASILGWSEVALHAAFLLPAVAAAIGTYFLAKRFCMHPLLATLITILCPVFLVSSTTLMCDTMMLAFWVWAVVLWIWSADDGRHSWAILSALLIAAAVITKYYAGAIIPLLLAYSLLRWRSVKWQVLYLFISVAIIAAYDWKMTSLYGHSVLGGASSYAMSMGTRGSGYLSRCAITLAFTGGCMAAVLFYSPMIWSRRVLLACLAGMGVLIWFVPKVINLGDDYTAVYTTPRLLLIAVQFLVLATGGVGLLALAGTNLWKNRNADAWLLALWMAGTFVFCSILNWTVNGRSILPMAPVAGILIAQRVGRNEITSQWRLLRLQHLPLALTGLLAFTIAWADTRLANTACIASDAINEIFKDQKEGVYFTGHWGFQYYMESLGYTALDLQRTQLKPGNVVILPGNNTNVPSDIADRAKRINKLTWVATPAISTMQPIVGAGFYASIWGPLPFAFGVVPPEFYRVMTIEAEDLVNWRAFELEEKIKLDPRSIDLRIKVSNTLTAAGRFGEAIGHLVAAMKLDQNNIEILNNLGWLLATQPPEQGGNVEAALVIAQRACKLTNNKNASCLDTLAAAYAASNSFPDAVATAQKAIDLASADGNKEFVKRIALRLELYKKNQAYRETGRPAAQRRP